MSSRRRCCDAATLCGTRLPLVVICISVATIVLSTAALIGAVATVSVALAPSALSLNKQPVRSVNLIFALVASSVSSYQIALSVLLLWQTLKTRGNIFISSVWYISHLAILTLYFLLCCTKIAVCIKVSRYGAAATTFVIGLIYEGIFIFFCVIMNMYINNLEKCSFRGRYL